MVRRSSRRRTRRRIVDRKSIKLARELDRLAREQPGGSPERPIPVSAPGQVDVIAGRKRCPACRVAQRLQEHVAATIGGVRLRVARVVCPVCGTKRSLYFRLDLPAVH